jgi:hypothetical protein
MSTLNKGYTRILGTDTKNTIDNTNDTQLTEIEVDMTIIESHLDDVTTNPHSVTKTQVGLGNCDNTADADKPVSSATITALAGKVATTRTVNANALSDDVVLDTSDIADTADKRYCTDAQKTIIGNTSGTNTGDQTDETLTFSDNTTNDVSTDMHGFAPKLPATPAGTFLRDDGQYAVPSTGGGNVNGPASSTDGNVALFNGTSGTLIKDSGIALPAGDIVTEDGTQTLTNKTLTTPIISAWDGWNAVSDSWTYAASDAPAFTITVPSGAGSLYSAGMKLKLTQTTVKYFIITKVSDTILTIYGGTDYTLANAAISGVYVSSMKAPLNFPLDPAKWTVEYSDTTNRSQASPANGTWYNINSALITIPIGVWRTEYYVMCQYNLGTATNVSTALSTANNTASDDDLRAGGYIGATGHIYITKSKIITLAAKTAYYLNTMCSTSGGAGTVYNMNADAKMLIRAICSFL